MSGAGEALQGYNAALLEALAELRARRDELSERIREEEAERGRLQSRIAALTERLARSSERTAWHLAARRQLDASIAESEAAYGKVRPSGIGAATFLNAVWKGRRCKEVLQEPKVGGELV
uniref:Uncharacterized protein n=1 Tax=Pavo cristatus TaxID=9049 RepID=A0A8C9G0H6_PAVCR